MNKYSSDWYIRSSLLGPIHSRIDPLAVGAKIVQIFCTNDKETMKLKLIFMIENFIFKLGCSNSKKVLK